MKENEMDAEFLTSVREANLTLVKRLLEEQDLNQLTLNAALCQGVGTDNLELTMLLVQNGANVHYQEGMALLISKTCYTDKSKVYQYLITVAKLEKLFENEN